MQRVKAVAVDVALDRSAFVSSRVQFSASNKISPSLLDKIKDLRIAKLVSAHTKKGQPLDKNQDSKPYTFIKIG